MRRGAIALGMIGLWIGAMDVGAAEERSACGLEAGSEQRSVRVGRVDRTYDVHVGRVAAERGDAPLVFLWHGFGQTARSIAGVLDPDQDWPEAIVVTPHGLRRRFRRLGRRAAEGWQVRQGELSDRDLRFFDAMREALLETGCVDARRVYSLGLSNGAFFSNLLGCVRAGVLAAIAPVAGGARLEETCPGTVPVLITHGTRDEVVTLRSAERVVAAWAEHNGCTLRELDPDGCTALPGCRTPVAVCLHPGGHFWPGSATPAAIEFFRSFELRDAAEGASSGD